MAQKLLGLHLHACSCIWEAALACNAPSESGSMLGENHSFSSGATPCMCNLPVAPVLPANPLIISPYFLQETCNCTVLPPPCPLPHENNDIQVKDNVPFAANALPLLYVKY